MKILFYTGIGITALWLQLTVVPLVELGGNKPNLPLITVLVMGIYWLEPWVFIYGALCGLALDVFSHGVLGIYALSYFGVSFLSRYAGISIYDNNILFGSLAVAGLSFVEGLASVTLFQTLDAGIPWWRWVFLHALPGAIYNGLAAPLVFLAFKRLGRWMRLGEH